MTDKMPETIYIVPWSIGYMVSKSPQEGSREYTLTSSVITKLEAAEKMAGALREIEKGRWHSETHGFQKAGRSMLIDMAKEALVHWNFVNVLEKKSS